MLKIPVRLEEVPVIASMVKDSMSRDLADFTAYSPKYNAAFVSDIATKVKSVETKTRTKYYVAQIKTITKNLYAGTESLRPKLTRLAGYIMLAKNDLNVAPEDFGIKEVRNKIGKKDIEGLLENMEITLMHVESNMAALVAQGFTEAAKVELTALKDSINGYNLQQNLKTDEKEAGVQANLGMITELWEIVTEVMDIGKRLYKYDNIEKAGDYTLATLLSRIRHETKTGILMGTVKSKSDGTVLSGARVEIVERGDVLVTDAEGEFTKNGLVIGVYSIKVTMGGFKEVIVQNVIIKVDETTELLIELEAN